jgi:hypothetical protein
MLIKVLDRSLVRRFNNSIVNVDSSMANTLVSRGLAVLVEDKAIISPPMDKMIKSPDIKKEIIPEIIKSEIIIKDESYIFEQLVEK